jgi:hypothetical protein
VRPVDGAGRSERQRLWQAAPLRARPYPAVAASGACENHLATVRGIMMTRRTALRWAPLGLAAVLLAGCGEGNVFALEAGTCFDEQGLDPDGADVSDVPIVECDDPHDNEVYAAFDLELAEYAAAAVEEAAVDGCYERFESYVGRDYETSRLDFGTFTPTAASWRQGDREVACFLFDVDGEQLTGSARDSGL